MKMAQVYSSDQLETIIDQATIYLCACPAQVADAMRKLRYLFDYQKGCVARDSSDINREVHERIASATAEAHRIMETCMGDILRLEGWDPVTLKMPAGLRQLLDREARQ
jgi:hypothetical protein